MGPCHAWDRAPLSLLCSLRRKAEEKGHHCTQVLETSFTSICRLVSHGRVESKQTGARNGKEQSRAERGATGEEGWRRAGDRVGRPWGPQSGSSISELVGE